MEQFNTPGQNVQGFGHFSAPALRNFFLSTNLARLLINQRDARNSSTLRRTCCEVRVKLSMTQYICAPLQSAGGFILEGDWTPTKTYLSQLTTYRGGSLIFFQDKMQLHPAYSPSNPDTCQIKSGKPESLPETPESDGLGIHIPVRSCQADTFFESGTS